MKLFKLTDDLKTNVDQIDDQHRELFDRLNNLINAVSRNDREVLKFLDFLKHYAVEHFGLEESFMRKFSYPETDEHLDQHATFRQRLSDLDKQIKEKSISTGSLAEMLEMEIGNWFVKHISSIDRKLTGFLGDRV